MKLFDRQLSTDWVTQLLPIIVIAFPNFVAVVPVMLALVWMYNQLVLIKLKDGPKYSFEITAIEKDGYIMNDFYVTVCDYLSRFGKVEVSNICYRTNKSYDDNGVAKKSVFVFGGGSLVVCNYNNYTISASFVNTKGTDTTTHIVNFTGAPNSVLSEFLEHCHAEMKAIYGKKPRSYYINTNESYWRGVPIRVNKTPSNIYIRQDIKERIFGAIDTYLQSKAEYDRAGCAYKLGMLLYGPPGTGKTSMIYAISQYTGRDIYEPSLTDAYNRRAFTSIFNTIPSGSIVAINDIDAMPCFALNEQAPELASTGQSYKIKPEYMYAILDGYEYLHDCIIIFTTNYIDRISPTVIRSGRIDHKFEITNADNDTVNRMLDDFGVKYRHDGANVNMSELVNSVIMPNLSGDLEKSVETYLRYCAGETA